MNNEKIENLVRNSIKDEVSKSFVDLFKIKNIRLITLDGCIKQFKQYLRQNCSQSYQRSHELSFRHLSNYFNGQTLLSEIHPRQLETLFYSLKERAPEGYRVYFRNIKSFFTKAHNWGYLNENPMLKIKLPKKVSNKPLVIIESTLQKITHEIENKNIKNIVKFGFYTGMRISEIVNLRWSNVNLTEKTVTIGDVNFTTKSKKPRIIPLPLIILNLLNEMFPKVIEIDGSFVFQKLQGIPFNTDHVSKVFKKAVRKLNLDDRIHFHNLRHSYASNLARKGVSLHEIRDLLGHSSVKTTEIYSHLNLDNLRNAVDKLN